MKLAISGTYSSGKTLTVMALSRYTGLPRTLAQSIREILPEAVPGKRLAECTPAEFLQLMMRRHVGRAEQESLLGDGFLSDGSSLQEWIYGAARVHHGMNPNAPAQMEDTRQALGGFQGPAEAQFFDEVVAQFGHAFRQHVTSTFDAFVHLRHELSVANDGHRPMNDRFRATCDEMMLSTVDELQVPYYVVGGSLPERIDTIVDLYDLPVVRQRDEAIALAQKEHAQQDMRSETERRPAAAGLSLGS